MERWWTQPAPQNICTCTQTSHAMGPQPGVGVERPTRRDAGSHIGMGGLPWESELHVTPAWDSWLKMGGQETPILPQG